MRCTALALAAVAAAMAAEYHGQVNFGGLPLPGVMVTAVAGERTLSAVTDQQGVYAFADLPDGNWTLHLEKAGFAPTEQAIAAGNGLAPPTLELKMLPLDGMATEASVATAVASAPAVPVPATTSSSTRAAATAAQAKNATAFQRTDLNGPATAAVPAADAAPVVTDELTQRASDGFLINGSANNGNASPFSQAPAFGNNRRGVRRLYTYALSLVDTNSALNAANYSLTGQPTPKPPFDNVTGTLSLGGPLRIPHLPIQNGPQFSLSYSRTENRSASVATNVMPDAAERAGNFANTLVGSNPVVVKDPATGAPFPDDRIPSSQLSPQALSLLVYYPEPNFVGVNRYNFQVPLVANAHTDNLRFGLSQNFRRRNLVAGSLAISDTRGDRDSQFQFLDRTRSLGINAIASYRRQFTPRFFGTLTFNYSRQGARLLPFFSDRVNVSGEAGILGNNQDPLNWGPPALGFNQSGIAGLGDGNASVTRNQTSALGYQGQWNRRTHFITFGGDYRRQEYNTIAQSNPRGTFTFNGNAAGFDFADFLLGIPDASAIAFGNADKYLRSTQPDLYFQDDWRLKSGITLLLGLRWEYTSPITEKYGRIVNLDIASGFTAIAPVVASDPRGPLTGMEYPASLIRPDYRELAPRLGAAWRPFAASSLVVRAGYSVGYNTQVYLPFVSQMVQQSPLSTSLNIANSAASPLTLANGFYTPPNIATNTIAVNPNLRIGYAQNWNVIVQRDLPGAAQVVAQYNGIKGTHQLQAFAPNTYPDGAVNPCASCPAGYTYYTSYGNSTREAAIVQLRRRMHHGILAQVQYTWSKSIDDAAALGGGGTGAVAQNWLNLSGERGLSSFDQRHLANFSLQYSSGMGIGGGTLVDGWRGHVLKDWTILTQINVGTGLPLTPVYAALIPGTGIPGQVRANYTGLSLYGGLPGYFLNPAAVAAPAPGEWGDAGRNSIEGPGQFSMNASLQRAFRLSERCTLNFRMDTTNPLNHVAITTINTTVTSSLFGQPAAVNGMRTVSTTMRLTF